MGCGSSKVSKSAVALDHRQPHLEQQQQQQQQPQQQQQQQQQQQSNASQNNPVAIDEQMVMNYVRLEKEINELEARNAVQMLRMKWDQLQNLDQQIDKLQAAYRESHEKMLKEKQDVDTVKQFLADASASNEQLTKEQEEYLSALNQMEVAEKELKDAESSRQSARIAVKELHVQAEKLQQLYAEQDAILTSIFAGNYGSEKEFQLECEHDACCERQQRIAAAKARWQAAKLLVQHAHSQLSHATKKWQVMCDAAAAITQEARINLVTEARNYLIAAGTNLRNSINYLRGIEFPYCKSDEIATLDRATNNIFNDMYLPERQQHAMSVYKTMKQRTAALLKWFSNVIDVTITKDQQSAAEQLFQKKKDLRQERVRLMIDRLVQAKGPDAAVGIDRDANLTDATNLQDQLASINEDELKKQLEDVQIVRPEGEMEEDRISISSEQSEAVSLKDLAPPPAQDQLFGDINSIKEQYEIDKAEFNRAQDMNRARVQQGLQEKLAARKTRKAQLQAEQQKLMQDSAAA